MAILYIRDPETGARVPIRAIKGEDGKQMFVRFSAYADGTDMSERWDAERDWMGIAFAPSAPSEPGDYQWIQLASLSFGRYAEEGSAEKYLFYVGGGTGEDDLRNVLTLDEQGNLHVSGKVSFGEGQDEPSPVGHTHGAEDVTDLLTFIKNYNATKIATGTYTGTGTEPNTLTAPFEIKFGIIAREGVYETKPDYVIFLAGSKCTFGRWSINATITGTTIKLSSGSSAASVLNASGVTYAYSFFG